MHVRSITRTSLALLASAALALTLSACRGEPSQPRVVVPDGSDSGEGAEPTSSGTPETGLTPLAELGIDLELVADGFDQPLFVTGAGDGSGRLFVVEKTGRIWIVRDGETLAEPFLDLSQQVSTESEQGLLGLAFYPSFAEDGLFVVDYTDTDGNTVVARFHATGDVADAGSEEQLLSFEQPYANHNGGMVAFGPDGYLYIGTGDGGSGGDPHGNGQNTQAWLGKLLRIDITRDDSGGATAPYAIPADNPYAEFHPESEAPLPEIWAYGLRNPWRFSFDRATGDLWIGDVGQNEWEEIDFQPADSTGGENYGWNVFEGTHPFPPGSDVGADPAGFVMPVIEYDHTVGKSVTGGYVYRGSACASLQGVYLYGDYVNGRVWGARRDSRSGTVAENELLLESGLAISSFGEDDDGELYVVDFGGAVYRVVEK